MSRQISWRCEACGATLTATGLVEVGKLDRIHAASCPARSDALAESRGRHPSTAAGGDVVDIDTGGRL